MKPDFWKDKERAQKVIQELNRLKVRILPFSRLKRRMEDCLGLIRLASEEEDESIEKEIKEEVTSLTLEMEKLRLSTLLSGEYDNNNAIFSIHAGAGGTEACDWVDILLRMYLRWAERNGYSFEVIDSTPGEEVGTKSITSIISGSYAYGYLKCEKGVHRLVRISPFDANKRRHTTFAAVDVIPEIEDELKVEIDPEDLRVEAFRSRGAGGQHVNKTSSAIRITHLPTGLVVQCQAERSQHKNKVSALKVLRSRLHDRLRKEQKKQVEELRGKAPDIAWGNQIRSYFFHPYQKILDHRTNLETANTQKVMDGELDNFIHAYLKQSSQVP